jgi:hypothetical protein
MSRAFDDYYIEDCDVILALEVTQRRIDNSDQFVILATVHYRNPGLCRVPGALPSAFCQALV